VEPVSPVSRMGERIFDITAEEFLAGISARERAVAPE
jgi:hypothetical protein